jgi:polyhydroxyalkanoate synthesis regulator phasin
VEIVALIAGIVSIVLAGFAIWQANHHRDQSDKLNRDTTEKLARIEAFATSTKEDAFEEIRRWGDFARAGGKAFEEAQKAKDEAVKNIKDEIEASTTEQINRALQAVESKISSSAGASAVEAIKREFEELKKEIRKIQDRAVAGVENAEKKRAISGLLGTLSVEEKAVLREIARFDSAREIGLILGGFKRPEVLGALAKAGSLAERVIRIQKDGTEFVSYSLDKDLREALRK